MNNFVQDRTETPSKTPVFMRVKHGMCSAYKINTESKKGREVKKMEEEIIKALKEIDWNLAALGLELDTWAHNGIEKALRLCVNRAYQAGHREALKEVLALFNPSVNRSSEPYIKF